jgi:RHS repeat-associated protein
VLFDEGLEMNCSFCSLCAFAISVLSSVVAVGQVSTGTPPMGSFSSGPDVTNLGNLNFHLRAPIFAKPGRQVSFAYFMGFDSSIWTPVTVNGATSWQPDAYWGWHAETTAATTGFVTYSHQGGHCNLGTRQDPYLVYYNLYTFQSYVDQFGTLHAINAPTVVDDTQCPAVSGYPTLANTAATDGSGYSFQVDSGPTATVYPRSGGSITPPLNSTSGNGTVTDSNGNQISVNGPTFTDTLGMTALTVSGSAPNPVNLTYTDSSGTVRTVTINYTTANVQTNFGCSGISEYGPAPVSLVSSISYPDGTAYSFTYEATPGAGGNVTGRVASVTFRTGATINYSYTGGSSGIICADGSAAGLARTTTDGTTTYSRSGSGRVWTTTITDAQNNQMVINFQSSTPPGGGAANFYETHRTVKQGTSTVLVQTDTCYNGSVPPCSSTAITTPLTAIGRYLTLNNSQQDLTNVNLTSSGLPTGFNEYDFGNGAPGPLLRTTSISYANLGNIIDHPAAITVYDGGGTQKAQQLFAYDGTTPAATSGVPQHLSVGAARGNLTSLSRWLDTTNSNLATTFTYDDTGNVLTNTDPGGHQTTFSYADNFADGVNRGSLAYLTQMSLPDTNSPNVAHHVVKTQYDANTGLPVKAWDQNNNITTLAYDLLLRPTQANFPGGGQTTVSYQSSTQTLVQSKIDGTRSISYYTQIDSYGRLSRTALANGESNPYDQQDFCYDSNGRLQYQSYRYQGSGFSGAKVCSGAVDTFAYDALGRITQVTHADGTNAQYSYGGRAQQISDEGNGSTRVSRIMQSDGLGRMTNVCEISATTQQGGGNVPSACGLDLAGTGFLTTYGYNTLGNLTSVTQGTLNSRTYAFDSLSRVTSDTEPESGTTTYTYNTDSLLTQRVRPKVNQTNSAVTTSTNYVYDSLHRLTQRRYSDATAPNAYFNYDEAAPLGLSVTNSIGRLTSEYNNAGPESLFSYDAMGRVVTNWQCALSSGCNSTANYWTYPYTYDLNGDILTSFNATTLTYSYNIAGRITGITSSLSDATHPGTLVSNVHYNQFGERVQASYGNVSSTTGITESRAYNGRGQPQSVSSYINGGAGLESFNGATYAPNGNMLSVNDQINYGNWSYGYDDLNRLKSGSYVGSPSASYTYDYDRYGNRWHQSGGTWNWSQTFDSNNHITGWSYDALGNLLNDGSHSYTYDAEGRLLTVDGGAPSGTTYVYDAEQRRVSRTTGTGSAATHYFNYDLSGHVVNEFNPVTYYRDEVYAVGWHAAIYSINQVFFPLVDWLGNERVKSTQTEAYEQSFANLPFGDGQTFWGNGVGSAGPTGFTGDEHDSESNLEHTMFRQYSSAEGRWTTPDPYLGSMDFANPQWLNRYTYAGNDPVNAIDPLGLISTPTCLSANGMNTGCGYGGGATGGVGGSGFGGGTYLDGALVPDDVIGLLAPSESVSAYQVGGLLGDMHLDQNGYPFNPMSNCYSNGRKIFCNPIGFAEMYPAVQVPEWGTNFQVPMAGNVPGLTVRAPDSDTKCDGAPEVAIVTIAGPMASNDVVEISSPELTVANTFGRATEDIWVFQSHPWPLYGAPRDNVGPVFSWQVLYGAYNPGVINWTFKVASILPSPYGNFTLTGHTKVTCGKAPVR